MLYSREAPTDENRNRSLRSGLDGWTDVTTIQRPRLVSLKIPSISIPNPVRGRLRRSTGLIVSESVWRTLCGLRLRGSRAKSLLHLPGSSPGGMTSLSLGPHYRARLGTFLRLRPLCLGCTSIHQTDSVWWKRHTGRPQRTSGVPVNNPVTRISCRV